MFLMVLNLITTFYVVTFWRTKHVHLLVGSLEICKALMEVEQEGYLEESVFVLSDFGRILSSRSARTEQNIGSKVSLII